MIGDNFSRLEKALSELQELNKKSPKDTLEFIRKFAEYYDLLKETVPVAVRKYCLNGPYAFAESFGKELTL